ncbi:MAG TPA: tetratricopeptide repeat protein [Burkholderiales bacterium]|nr:tetratricopeptide repeat protein [Burkholderiales bacterium]
MTPYDILLLMFWLLFAMATVWLVCVVRFVRLVRDSHPEAYGAMNLDEMWPKDAGGWLRGHNNAKAVSAMLRFVLRREDRTLQDSQLSRLCAFMKSLFVAFVGGFATLIAGMLVFAALYKEDQAGTRESGPDAALLDRAYELHRAQQWTQAIDAYDQLIARSDTNADVRYWRGIAHLKLGHADAALRDFRRALELKPDSYAASGSAVRILADEGRWDEVIAVWNAYLEHAPNDPNALYYRGGAHFRKHDLDRSLADADKACKLGRAQACAAAEHIRKR